MTIRVLLFYKPFYNINKDLYLYGHYANSENEMHNCTTLPVNSLTHSGFDLFLMNLR
jgi:hypothetical protein